MMDEAPRIARPLLAWYRTYRREFPWRDNASPYAILVSEIMLQQTQAARVSEILPRWLRRFPTIETLARARARSVLLAWSGLGYNRRALALHACARAIVRGYGGRVPSDPGLLRRLPGIGRYTADAVACFAYGAQRPVVDVNIRRIYSRLVLPAARHDGMLPDERVYEIAAAALPRGRAFDFNQALMDLGATVCLQRIPRCGECPIADRCASAFRVPAPVRQTRGEADAAPPLPRRIYRGRAVQYLRTLAPSHACSFEALGVHLLPFFSTEQHAWLADMLGSLQRDGLVGIRYRGKPITVPPLPAAPRGIIVRLAD
jgi:A/G-specific adenine glycosylase